MSFPNPCLLPCPSFLRGGRRDYVVRIFGRMPGTDCGYIHYAHRLTVSVPSSAKIRIMTLQMKGDSALEGHKFTAQHGNTIEVRQYPLGRVSNGIIEL
jgi:hypothetical protein